MRNTYLGRILIMLVKQYEDSFCPKSEAQPREKPQSMVLDEINAWMTSKLPCVAGKREYRLGRYMISNASKATVPNILTEYLAKLPRNRAVACLMVFNNPAHYEGSSDVGQTFRFLADQMALISDVSSERLANGAALSKSVELRCPVTNQVTVFDDFECIAFCPQSADKRDRLYDPLMYAPYPCVNISSDTYAFSRFVADSAQTAWGKMVFEEKDLARVAKLLDVCVQRWQRIAKATIGNFIAITDTSLCPVHISNDEKHWIAAHKDPAFAEQIKEAHQHELPVVYARRIADRWLDFFAHDKSYQATGAARAGVLV